MRYTPPSVSLSPCAVGEAAAESVSPSASSLSDVELLARLLAVAPRARLPLENAQRLLERFGSARGVARASFAELAAAGAISRQEAARLKLVLEFAARAASEPMAAGVRIDSSDFVFAHFAPLFAGERRETFHALMLDSKNRLIAKRRISEGSLGASLVHPREAFRAAVREAAAAVIFLHNHPSGDPSPSREDRRITARLREVGELLGIPVLDHLVIGRSDYFSFADSGWEGALIDKRA